MSTQTSSFLGVARLPAWLAKCSAIILTVALVPAGYGQLPLSLEEALIIGERNNPALAAARAQLAAAEAERNESRALLWNNAQLTAEARQRSLATSPSG